MGLVTIQETIIILASNYAVRGTVKTLVESFDPLEKPLPQNSCRSIGNLGQLYNISEPCTNSFIDQQAVTALLDLAETYGGHANTMGQQSAGTIKGAHADN